MFETIKKLLKAAPKPLAIAFITIFIFEFVMNLLTLQGSALFRWVISSYLMFKILQGDKTAGMIFSGLLFFGGLLMIIFMFSTTPIIVAITVLISWSLAGYIMFAPAMKQHFLQANNTEKN